MIHKAALLLVVIFAITTGVFSGGTPLPLHFTSTTSTASPVQFVNTTATSSPSISTTPTPAPSTRRPSTSTTTSPPAPSTGTPSTRTPSTTISTPTPTPSTRTSTETPSPHVTPKSVPTTERPSSTSNIIAPWRVESMLNPQQAILEEIRSLGEESTDAKIQKELVKAMKAASKSGKKKAALAIDEQANLLTPIKSETKSDPEKAALKELMEDEDLNYETDGILMPDDSDWDDDDDLDELTDDEEILFEQNCPIGCRCSGEYAAATTARCTKLSGEQNFGPDIAHLRIENAPDIELGPHSLRTLGLHQLESIAFVDTRISAIERTAFDGVPDLFSVNLTRNGILGIHPDTFQNNTQLSLLTLSGNPLQYTQVKNSPYSKYFLDAPSVSEIDLSNNALPRLLPTAFVRMPRLDYINLRGNKLRAIERAIFKPLDQLEEIDLSNNQLNGLPLDVFDDNKYLEILHISGNNLTTLATIKAERLVSLDAAKNRIKIVAKDDLAGLSELERLDLRSNGLKRIHQHAFSRLLDLTYLDISNNKLTTLTEHHLRSNSDLEILIMNDNPGLETLPVFKSEDGSFRLYRFECADCGLLYLEAGTFDSMPALTRLNLARNRLSRFPKGLTSQLSALRELDLSDNLFSAIEVDMFRGARTLTKLNLAGNPLTTLQVAPFLLTPSLARLDLSRCALDRIWSDTVVPLQNLRSLSVRGNRIERINVEDLQATPKLSNLDISHNPLECDQEFNAAIQWLVEHGVSHTETLRYLSNYGNPEEFVGSEGINQWTDLAKVICDSIDDGPSPKHPPLIKPSVPKKTIPELKDDELDDFAQSLDHGRAAKDEQLEDAWLSEEQEYQEFITEDGHYRPWYAGTMWPVLTVILVTLAVVLLVANFAVCISKRRGRGPVIRTPMILRPGLIDNKNCGLVYKPLQEEIPTPQMAKRGSFYSSSTFHYDKIVPESV